MHERIIRLDGQNCVTDGENNMHEYSLIVSNKMRHVCLSRWVSSHSNKAIFGKIFDSELTFFTDCSRLSVILRINRSDKLMRIFIGVYFISQHN